MTDINVGDTWTLTPADGLGTGIGAIPAGAEVVIDAVLPPFTAGVERVDENTVCCIYTFSDFVRADDGTLVEGENKRRLAFCESSFLSLFSPPGGGS